MLQELTIKDFAIIDSLAISFEKGMTVLSGETGAGKSIIIDAVGLLAGGRGSQEFIRTGAEHSLLQGLFKVEHSPATLEKLTEYGIDPEADEILFQREIHRNGRNVCRINGQLVNISTLRAIGETIVDIHGQNEHQELMHAEHHLSMLDEFAKKELSHVKIAYDTAYTSYQKLRRRFLDWQKNEQSYIQRIDMLKFQINEISEAQLQADEELKLISERDRLNNFQKIQTALVTSYEALNGEEVQGVDLVGSAMNEIQNIADLSPEFAEISENISSAFYSLSDAVTALSRQIDDLEMDEERQNQVEQRLESIHQLKRKYGSTVPEILAYNKKIQDELNALTGNNEDGGDLESAVTSALKEVEQLAQQLTTIRQKAAKKLTKAVHQQLSELYMEKTRFEVRFEKSTELLPIGQDVVEFYIQPNPGEEMKPLAKIASGGELSRMMLALKTIFSQAQGITSIIFDEVDTGVSGRVAQAIANKISLIAQHSQVLCITHLPQVAAVADHHFWIQKEIVGKRTETKVINLDQKGRVNELARMLAGEEVTQLALEHARELLNLAHKNR